MKIVRMRTFLNKYNIAYSSKEIQQNLTTISNWANAWPNASESGCANFISKNYAALLSLLPSNKCKSTTSLQNQLLQIYKNTNMSKIKIYIAGPITDLPNNNIEEFQIVASLLQQKGYDTVVPHNLFENIDTQNFTHQDYMNVCLPVAKSCDCLCFLEGWKDSKGSIMEMEIAIENNLKIVFAKNYLADYISKRNALLTSSI
jgi:hypothetical protein